MRIPYQPDHYQEISRHTLCKADYAFSSPFFISLPDHQEPIFCEEIIRLIPGKRLVAFGHWKNKPIVAKLFFGRQAKQQMQRDLKGIQALLRAKIPTPALLYSGKSNLDHIHLILSERISSAQSLETFWQSKKNSPESEAVLHSLTLELATQHVLGLLQQDLHLKNFLIATEHIYTLDGTTIHMRKGPLSKKRSLENIALFFSQLGMQTNKLQQRLFYTYIQSRGWLVKKTDIHFLQNAIRQWNRLRWLRYQKKIFRSSTQFAKTKNGFTLMLYDRNYFSSEFQQFLQQPDALFNHPDTIILKAGRTSTVIKITLGQQVLVVKRYNIKNIWHGLRRMLKPTRAALSWRLAHQLQFVGIATAKPVAFIEKRILGLRGKSYFIMEYVEGVRADHFFDQISIENHQCIVAAKRLITLFFNLARLRLCHGDLKITNIMLNNHQEPVLLDLDSMREHHSSHSLWHRFRKDMQRFLKNWQGKPSLHQLFQRLIANLSQ